MDDGKIFYVDGEDGSVHRLESAGTSGDSVFVAGSDVLFGPQNGNVDMVKVPVGDFKDLPSNFPAETSRGNLDGFPFTPTTGPIDYYLQTNGTLQKNTAHPGGNDTFYVENGPVEGE